MFQFGELEFRDGQECAVCYSDGPEMKFPTNCGHWFCVKCCRSILFWDETRYHLSPEPYGCPPCPNGCVNQVRGKQCYCEEYDNVQNKWEKDFPENWQRWNDDEHESIENSHEDPGSVFTSKRCPMCRMIYDK